MRSRSTWHRVKTLGAGGGGTVYLAQHTNGNTLAVKTAKLEDSSSLTKENKILDYFRNCPEIVQFYGSEITIEEGLRYYNLFLEYAAAGDLLDLMERSGGRISQESVLRKYAMMILNGLSHIHAKGIVHCDIKPENILVFPSKHGYQLKITDFGLAKEPGDVISARGTPDYMSPESVAPHPNIEPAMDIWSLGCVLLVMFTGTNVWRGKDGEDLKPKEIVRILASTDLVPKIPKDMSKTGKHFLRMCLQRDPSKRWSARMLLCHPYVTTEPDVLYNNLITRKLSHDNL